ncbi:hypothetical protein [Oryzihumus leptocrescens]|nr:hypothetical protein [Oryzihumus leptocrescens]
MNPTAMASDDRGSGAEPTATTMDLPSRIRQALRQRDEAELAFLNPIVLALAKGEVTVSDIEALDAEQAMWLVAARVQERGDIAAADFIRNLHR